MMPKWLLLSFIVMFLIALGSFLGKVALLKDSSMRVYFFEAIGTLTVFTVFALINREAIFSNFSINPYGLLMGISWGVGTVVFLYALEIGKVSLIVPLTALYPAIAVILAVIFLGETLGPREIAGIALAIIAGMLLAK